MQKALEQLPRNEDREQVRGEPARSNVSEFIFELAKLRPLATAVIEHRTGRKLTFGELAHRVENMARGLRNACICDGARAVLAIKPGIEFFVTVFALFRSGATLVVVDPGMGKRNLLACIEQVRPDALVGIPVAHALSLRYRRAFGTVKVRVTIGRRWIWGGPTYNQLVADRVAGTRGARQATSSDIAAILFTSGATGAPKGVVYHHGIFVEQVRMIRNAYDIQPGEVDVACFALFALFSVAMGVTVVLPDINFARPGACDPAKVVAAIHDHNATMSFASPAVWRKVGPYLHDNRLKIESVRRILIAGASVPSATLAQLKPCIAPDGDIHTPYGATESLPFTTISANEVLGDTRHDTQNGAGVCVGRPLPGVRAKVVRIADGPIESLAQAVECGTGEVGEILVSSAVTTREYFERPQANLLSKVKDVDHPSEIWHRMGDSGYFDVKGRLWYCGRVAHTVWTAQGPMFPEQIEGVLNNHNAVARTALVGLGAKGAQEPVVVVELHGGHLPAPDLGARIESELLMMAGAHKLTRQVKRVLFHRGFPVDARHNSKIDRESLARWAAGEAR